MAEEMRKLLLKHTVGHVTQKEVQINKFPATKSSKEWLCRNRSQPVERRADPNNGATCKNMERRNSTRFVIISDQNWCWHIWTETTNNFLIR